MQHANGLWRGVGFALAAGLMWGLVFVSPLMLPGYPPAVQSVGRYLAFGLVVLPLAWMDRRALGRLTRADWLEALKLSVVGNFLYYLLLASAIQRTGGPLATLIIGTLPVVISVSANRGRERLPWHRVLPSLGLIALGIACVNHDELTALAAAGVSDRSMYWSGAGLAVGALACWTWYPLRNAAWLSRHADCASHTWATAQGLMTLPLALLGCAGVWVVLAPAGAGVGWLLGPQPERFVLLMVAMGVLASWAGTLCWSVASRCLPTTLLGQFIVFETLAALGYAFLWRSTWPAPWTLAGITLLVVGVLWAVRAQQQPVVAQAHPD